MAKPFNIQSPEDIAKSYGGNKQKIAQAMQAGVVDPTAGVLAGMFIDRMRAAQLQEAAPQPTVAQQVMGGAPAGPQATPPSPAGGLGATPQAAPPMAPPQGGSMPPPMAPPPEMMQGGPPMAPPPEMMPEEAMGMADGGFVPPHTQGGLDGLPVPDTMFDEPSNGGFNDGYADGGLVAFAGGGGIDPERLRRALLAQESGGDYGVPNREGSGAMGAYQFMPDTARRLAARIGLDYRPEYLAGATARTKEGKAYQERLMDEQMSDILKFAQGDLGRAAKFHFAGGNQKRWGSKTRKYEQDILRRYAGSKDTSGPEGIERDLTSGDPYAVPDVASVREHYEQFKDLLGERGGDQTQAYLDAVRMSPDRLKEMKRMNEAAALAAAAKAFGTRGPLLGQIGEALGSATGALATGKAGIREAELEGLKAGMTQEQQAYLDRLGILDPAVRARAADVGLRESALGRKARSEETKAELALRERQLQDEKDYRNAMVSIADYKAKHPNMSNMETVVSWVLEQGLAKDRISAYKYALENNLLKSPGGGEGSNLDRLREKVEGGGAGGEQMVDVAWPE